MQQRTLKIIVVCLIFLQSLDSAAQIEAFAPHSYPFFYLKGIYTDPPFRKAQFPQTGKFIPVGNRPISPGFTGTFSARGIAFSLASTGRNLGDQRLLANPIQPNYYSLNTGFCCRTEWQFEKTTTIPLRFRLGMIDYVNYLEHKPNAIQPRQ